MMASKCQVDQHLWDSLADLLNSISSAVFTGQPRNVTQYIADHLDCKLDKRTIAQLQFSNTYIGMLIKGDVDMYVVIFESPIIEW